MNTITECFSAGISALKRHGWLKNTQKVLAQKLNYTSTHLSQVFSGKRTAGPELQEKIAEEFGVHVEEIIRIGRNILEGKGFFPFTREIEELPAHSEEQAHKIVMLTNRQFGIEGHLKEYRPEGWSDFVSGKISVSEFYSRYANELQALIKAIKMK